MNVFVLNTGRCGSTTFSKACAHIVNFSSGHESRVHRMGEDRVAYPENHIEADHYLSWHLGRLDAAYGDSAFYVHLTRDPEKVIDSWNHSAPHWIGAIAHAYHHGFLKMAPVTIEQANRDRIETVTANIRHFLKDKTRVMNFRLETATDDWPKFWQWIGAEGDHDAALAEWSVPHNERGKGWDAIKVDLQHRKHHIRQILRLLLPG